MPEVGASAGHAQELGDDVLDGHSAATAVLAVLYAPQQLLQLLPRDPDLHLRGSRRRVAGALALARLLPPVLHPHGVRPGVMHGARTAAATATRPLETAVSHRSVPQGGHGTVTEYGDRLLLEAKDERVSFVCSVAEMIGAWKKPQIVYEGGRGGVVIGAGGRGGQRRRGGEGMRRRTGQSHRGEQMRVRDTWMAVIGVADDGPVGGPTTSPRWLVVGCGMGWIGLRRCRKV